MTSRLWARARLGGSVQLEYSRQDDGSAHVEVVAGRYDIVVTERGQEFERISGLSTLAAARWFLIRMAEAQAQSAEANDRRALADAPPTAEGPGDNGYSCWNWMVPAIATMRQIAPDLGDWAARYYADVLRHAPLSDSERRNARYPLPALTGAP